MTDLFSVKISIRTLFAPWKRDKISYEGLTLQQKFQVWSLNMASRFIGLIIKVIALTIYLIAVVAVSIFSVFLIIFWPLMPFVALYLIVIGITKQV